MVCGKLVCFQQETGKCLECDDGYEWNQKTMQCEQKCVDQCEVWFDGCNDYICEDNNIAGKTEKKL